MISTNLNAIEREVRIHARPDTIFPFFTDPDLMIRWMGASAELDPRPGGIYRVDVDGAHVARGEFVEISSPDRVVFTWGWETEGMAVPPGGSTVAVTLVPDGDHTIVRVVHTLPSADVVNGHAEGWDHYLPRLVIVAGGGDPGADPWVTAAGDAG